MKRCLVVVAAVLLMMPALLASQTQRHVVAQQLDDVPLVWQTDSPPFLEMSAPMVFEKLTLVSVGSSFTALDTLTGARLWGWEDVQIGPVAVEDGFVYGVNGAVTAPKQLIAFDAETGSVVWKSSAFMGDMFASERAPIVSNGIVYFSDGGIELSALDAKTGEDRWRYRGEESAHFAVAGDHVVLFGGGSAAAFDAESGEERWRHELGGVSAGVPIILGDRVLLASKHPASDTGPTSSIVALDLDSGEIAWQASMGELLSTPAAGSNQLYLDLVQEGVRYLVAFDAESGEERWRTKTNQWSIQTAPIEQGGVVVVATDLGELFALDAETGSVIWTADDYRWEKDRPAIEVAYGIVWIANEIDGRYHGRSLFLGNEVAQVQATLSQDMGMPRPVVAEGMLLTRIWTDVRAFDVSQVEPIGSHAENLVAALSNLPIETSQWPEPWLEELQQSPIESPESRALFGVSPVGVALTEVEWLNLYAEVHVFDSDDDASDWKKSLASEVEHGAERDGADFDRVDIDGAPDDVDVLQLVTEEETLLAGLYRKGPMVALIVSENSDSAIARADLAMLATSVVEHMALAQDLVEFAERDDAYERPPAVEIPDVVPTAGPPASFESPGEQPDPEATAAEPSDAGPGEATELALTPQSAPSETPIPTEFNTPTVTWTPTPSFTPTSSFTPTTTPTATSTATFTPTQTSTVTVTPTQTATPTVDAAALSFDVPPDWAGQGGNPFGTGEVEIPGIAQEPELAWSADLCERRCRTILVAGDKLFVSDEATPNVLSAHDVATGDLLWSAGDPESYGYFKDPVVANGRLFVNWHADLVALDIETGELLWATPMKASNEYGALTVIGDLVVYSNGYELGAVRASDGQKVWTNPVGVGRPYWTGTFIVGADYGRVVALDPSSGEIQWEQAIDGFEPRWGWMAIEDGPIVLANQERIIALAPDSGDVEWTVEVPGAGFKDAPGYWDGLVIARLSDELVAFDASSGDEAWRVALPMGVPPDVGRLVVSDGIALMELNEHSPEVLQQIVAFDATTGELLWSVSPSRTPSSNTYNFEAAGDWLVVSTGDRQIIVYQFAPA